MEKRYLKLKFRTPVHISYGEVGEITPLEYAIDNKSLLHCFNPRSLLRKVPEKYRKEAERVLEDEESLGLQRFFKSLALRDPEFVAEQSQYSMKAGDLFSSYQRLDEDEITAQLAMTPFIRTANKKFLPGSSLKGVFRTAMLCGELSDSAMSYDLNKNKKRLERRSQEIEAKTFEYWKEIYTKEKKPKSGPYILKDPFKTFKVRDEFVDEVQGKVNKIYVMKKDSMDKFQSVGDILMFVETIPAGTEVVVETNWNKDYFERVPNNIGKPISFDMLKEDCKSFYSKVLQREIDYYFTEFDRQMGSSIVKIYEDFLETSNNNSTFMVRLGRYGGRNSTSINIYNQAGKEPNSRSLIREPEEGYLPLGWVQVSEV